jgi:hypothetical protein
MRSGVAEHKPRALDTLPEVKDDTCQIRGAVDIGHEIEALIVEAEVARNVRGVDRDGTASGDASSPAQTSANRGCCAIPNMRNNRRAPVGLN